MDRHTQNLLLVYDGTFSLCISLAELVERRSEGKIAIIPWLTFDAQRGAITTAEGSQKSYESIGVYHLEKLHLGFEAWDLLLSHYPDLKGINWLANKVGIRGQAIAGLQFTPRAARMLCRNCSGYINRISRRQRDRK